MRKTTTTCDLCGHEIRDMHMGLSISPEPGALKLGDWRDSSVHFCGIVCLSNYIMTYWPQHETVAITRAITAGKILLQAFRQGVLAKRNAQWLIWLIAEAMELNDILIAYPGWKPDSEATARSKVTVPGHTAKAHNETLKEIEFSEPVPTVSVILDELERK